ncbi:hypothetical protein TNCV_4319171 [Trichonephila clavipes]|nr:hypothetical protein TNCV_4319171 [Trichonephila clavipes]
MWLRDPSLLYTQSAYHHVQWCNEVGVISPVYPSFPPTSRDDRSTSQLFGFVQHADQFLRKIIRNPQRSILNSSSVEFRNGQKTINVFHKA